MEYPTDGCTWLYVPYAKREQAKELGARWDALTKRWYLPARHSTTQAKRAGFLKGRPSA